MRFRDHHRRHRFSKWEGVGAFLRHPARGTACSLRRIFNATLSRGAGDLNFMKEVYRSLDPTLPKELGCFLRRRREELGISLPDASTWTCIKRDYIEAIERGDFDALPGGLFNKTFVHLYAKYLDIPVTALSDYYVAVPMESAPISASSTPPQSQAEIKETQAKRPPRLAEYLLYLFLTKSERVNLIGDTEEEYIQVLDKFGRRAANGWYYKQVFDSLRPIIKRNIMRIGIVAGLCKHYSKIAEYVHYLISILNSK